MNTKKIIAIGIELASDDIEHADFDSNTSLLDWDIVLFKPQIDTYLKGSEEFKGKPSLSESNSFDVKAQAVHWQREITQAVHGGKTVVVFMPEYVDFYVDSGEKNYSGSGRNRHTTRLVTPFNNYEFIPYTLRPIATVGKAMRLAHQGAELLALYWNQFGHLHNYQVVLSADDVPTVIQTKKGEQSVGALVKHQESGGALLLLPDLDFYQDTFTRAGKDGDDWTEEAEQFAVRLASTIVGLDRALKSEGEVTPEPAWSQVPEYKLTAEAHLHSQLVTLESQIDALQRQKESLLADVDRSAGLRRLLYEKGKPLEDAIIDALKILGFAAALYKDSNSEFDVVFESTEGRLIGEVEGKDNKAVNVEKLRQLGMNIQEDLLRDEVETPAKPVLFGNAFRLVPLAERLAPFTNKCLLSSEASRTALVATCDLFTVAQHVSDTRDEKFAAQCREAILRGVGPVAFPATAST